MKIKKLLAILLAGAMIFTAAGCSESTETLPVESEGQTADEEPEGKTAEENRSEAASDEASKAADETGSKASGAETVKTTESAAVTTTAEPEKPRGLITMACGELGGCFNGLFATLEGDKFLTQLVMPSMLVIDRQGKVVYNAGEGETRSTALCDYNYQGVVTIDEDYDKESNATTYSIKVRDDAVFSDGTPITADDLIFTYYVLCDPSYDGPSQVQFQNIFGVRAYQLNNTAAPGIEVTNSDVNKALGNPSEGLRQAIIDAIIRPTLEEERAWCEANWERYVDRGYGNSAEELFVTLYTSVLSSTYKAGDKSFDQIVDDTVELFGMNYKTLAKNYKNDIDYFNEKVKTITRNYLYETLLEKAGGEEMPRISGITKTDNSTVSVRVLGKSSTVIRTICDIPILSLHYYGNEDLYNYDADQFGLVRGDLTSIRAKDSQPLGYGPYQFVGTDGAAATLTENKYYDGTAVERADLKLIWSDTTDRLSQITGGTADLADLELTDTEIASIRETNENGSLNGDQLKTVTYNDDTYYYFGMNVNRVNVNDGELTEASLHMRRAIGMVISAVRAEKCYSYYGETAKLINYPCSTSFDAMPTTPIPAAISFTESADGTALTKDNVMDAVREELTAAGYTFKEEGRISHLPTGGKLKFTVHVPPYLTGDNAMTAILAEAKVMLESIGFEISFKEYSDINEFVITLSGGKADMWVARRSASAILSPAAYYTNGGTSNYYKLRDTTLDRAINSMPLVKSLSARTKLFTRIFNQIIEDAIEVPVYQKQCGIVYNAEKIYIDPNTELTEYFSLNDDFSAVRLLENVPESERATKAETTEAETTAEKTTEAETKAEKTTEVETGSAAASTKAESEAETAGTSAAETTSAASSEPASTEAKTTAPETTEKQ